MMNRSNADIWVDLVSPSHPFFFHSLKESLGNEYNFHTTVRDKGENIDLAEMLDFDYSVIGRDYDDPRIRKLNFPIRAAQLYFNSPDCDITMCSRDSVCLMASKARGIPSIHFTDNDITAHVDGLTYEEIYSNLITLATYTVVPKAFEEDELISRGVNPDSIYKYSGYKEDVSVAAFNPNQDFTKRLPFDDFIVLRPEALTAAYVDAKRSLVPDIISGAISRGYNVVYLPRGRGDKKYVEQYSESDVFVPDTALDGLQLAWHSDGVLTGSGTMAREAACMSKPAVSFFPNTPLSVDQQLIENNRVLHSRSPPEILDYLDQQSESDLEPDRSRAQSVRQEIAEIISSITSIEMPP